MNGALSNFPIIANEPSPRLVEAVKTFEGFSPTVYLDGGGKPTWGFGFTEGEQPKEPMTEEQAHEMLVGKLRTALREVQTIFRVPFTLGQQDALTDMYYNVGPGCAGEKDGLVWLKEKQPTGVFARSQHSTLYNLIQAKDYVRVANEFPKWTLVKGKLEEGLVKRAEIRRQWWTEYLTGTTYSFSHQWAVLNARTEDAKKSAIANQAAKEGAAKVG